MQSGNSIRKNLQGAILGFQHLLTMYSGDVIVPILIGTALHFSTDAMTYLIATDIFMCGVATLLQLKRTPLTGIGLPVVLGCAIQYVAPLQQIGAQYDVGTMYGAIIGAGIFIFLIAGLFSKIKVLFPPVVTGSLITVIGFSLVPVAVQDLGGGNPSAANFGDGKAVLIGMITLSIIVLLNLFASGFMKAIAVLIGMLAGTTLAAVMGLVSLSAVDKAQWFRLPQPFYFGMPHFQTSSIITLILVALTTMVESTGVFFALGDIVGRKIDSNDLKRGYRAEGLAAIIGGIFNTFPYSTFSENVGLVQMSGIKTRRPIYYSAVFLMLLGIMPKVAALALIMPNYVLGGAMIAMFGMVGVQGIRILQQVNFNDNNQLLIVAVSVGLGLGVTFYPQILNSLPASVKIILANGIVITSITAVLLNILFNILGHQGKLQKTRGKF